MYLVFIKVAELQTRLAQLTHFYNRLQVAYCAICSKPTCVAFVLNLNTMKILRESPVIINCTYRFVC